MKFLKLPRFLYLPFIYGYLTYYLTLTKPKIKMNLTLKYDDGRVENFPNVLESYNLVGISPSEHGGPNVLTIELQFTRAAKIKYLGTELLKARQKAFKYKFRKSSDTLEVYPTI